MTSKATKILLDSKLGRLEYVPNFISPSLCAALDSSISWQQDIFRIYGREIPLPRLTAWYGDPDATYRYSGITNRPRPWIPLLLDLKQKLEQATGGAFNSVLLNRYADGSQHQGYHTDNEAELGDCPLIASLSFGATRRFAVKQIKAFAAAIVLNLPVSQCIQRNQQRSDRQGPFDYIERQARQLEKSLGKLEREGFRNIFQYDSVEAIDALTVVKQRLWTNRRDDHGPFDVIGDVHGCYDELTALLLKLGCQQRVEGVQPYEYAHPQGRLIVFLGDLADRGPQILNCLFLVMVMVRSGQALCVPGNHEIKLLRYLNGKQVKLTHGLAETVRELEQATPEFVQELREFLRSLVSHYVLDDGRLVVAHAGLSEELQGRTSGAVRAFALYGQTTGESDEYGLPIRYPWAMDYRGKAVVVYGHTPVPEAEWINHTICIDTGCVYGGKLTALRWPERELVSVNALLQYFAPIRPFGDVSPAKDGLSGQQRVDATLHLQDFVGKQIIETQLHGRLSIQEEEASVALEAISRYAVDPRWLIYLPPTMSPSETSEHADYLEHPREALRYFATRGVKTVVCQEKHMGSRTLLVICRDAAAAKQRFGITNGEIGKLYSRRGRPLLSDPAMEQELLAKISATIERSGLWNQLNSDWLLLDCELLPWSFKAEPLIKRQYAATAHAGNAMLTAAIQSLSQQRGRHAELEQLHVKLQNRLDCITSYQDVYGRYSWEVKSVGDLKLAAFHLLASEAAVHSQQSHAWHQAHLDLLAQYNPDLFKPTSSIQLDPNDSADLDRACQWWEQLTAAGGEGMVIKPLNFLHWHGKRIIQPALKVRGREYLRLFYGPEYTIHQHLERLRKRSVASKRSLALRETALGLEALERFVRRAPLRRVHQCVFAILALESAELDPRL